MGAFSRRFRRHLTPRYYTMITHSVVCFKPKKFHFVHQTVSPCEGVSSGHETNYKVGGRVSTYYWDGAAIMICLSSAPVGAALLGSLRVPLLSLVGHIETAELPAGKLQLWVPAGYPTWPGGPSGNSWFASEHTPAVGQPTPNELWDFGSSPQDPTKCPCTVSP